MTVVVGIDYFDEILVIADTRVSYPDGGFHRDCGLKKLLVFGNTDKVAVLGFSGKVGTAKAVINHLMTERLTPNYKRPFVITRLKDDIRKWIQEVTTALPANQVEGFRLILCALETLRRRPLKRDGKEHLSSFCERHIYTYRVRVNGEVRIQENTSIAVIGSGKKLESKIAKNVKDLISFGRKMPNFKDARSTVLSHVIASLFQDIDSKDVGGPFEIVRIAPTPNLSKLIYHWPHLEDTEIEVEHQGDKTSMRNCLTGEQYILLPIWMWPWG